MPAALPKNINKNAAPIVADARTFSLIKRVGRSYLCAYSLSIGIAIIFMAIAGAMSALIAALMQPILDDVLYGQKEHMIVPVALAVAFTFIVRGGSTYIHTILMNKTGHSVVADVQKDLFVHFMKLDLAFFHDHPSGQLISRVVNDVGVMRSAVTDTLTGIGKSFFTLIFLIAVMVYQDWKLSLAAFTVFPLLSYFVIYIGKRLRKVSRVIQHEMGGLSDLLSQTFQGIRLIMAYNMEDHEIRKIDGAICKVRDLNIKSARLSTLSTPVNEALVGGIFAAIIIYGGYEVLAGRTTPGHLVSFIAAFTMAYEPMKKLAKLNNALQVGLGAAERIFAMMDQVPQITDTRPDNHLFAQAPDIEFDSVSFSYAGDNIQALDGVSFTAHSGQVTALVGASGSGKSTIINLILRFYDVDDGKVLLGKEDVRDVSLSSLREHIALVSQDITIFNDSVMENIRYGNLQATDKAVIEAAKAAAAHEFIEGFSDGYDTVVGEDGVKLSGGQRQRLSIARALLRDAPVLLLDEATSALDNESEKKVQEALQRLEEGRTTLVIAHRLSTVQEADQIIVMDGGKIIEIGQHKRLLAMGGAYAKMYETGL